MADARLEDAKPRSANAMGDMDMAAAALEEQRRKAIEEFADLSIRHAFVRYELRTMPATALAFGNSYRLM